MADASTFAKIKIGIASPEEIRDWSYGEVKKPETINYRTFRPERDGLFCERIFGPVKDWECHCGRYKKVKFKGIICERCGVEVTRAKVRRERMGHIELAAPVCHIWYLKAVPSPLALILDLSPRNLERVLYFQSHIITDFDQSKVDSNLTEIRSAVEEERIEIEKEKEEIADRLTLEFNKELQQHLPDPSAPPRRIPEPDEDLEEEESEEELVVIWSDEVIAQKRSNLIERIRQEEKDAEEQITDMMNAVIQLEKLQEKDLITEDIFRSLEHLMGVLAKRLDDDSWYDVVRAGQGGAAAKELLERIDMDALKLQLRIESEKTQGARRVRAIKRLELVEALLASRTRPEWMILDAVPVISPEIRPMVQLDGGRFATSDLNDLYRRIINRNNRLKRITEIRAPESIVNHEKRLLQEAVDALIDNGRRQRPVVGSNNRALKSLSDMLKGKEGRFRKNLLGKRVDYSGRSVIVVGPHLKLHQCGLPKEMALELFKPFVMKTLVERGYTTNIKTAKRMIERTRPEVWDALEEVIREHPVLLNRAPTLHRLGIQAFEPILIEGKAIQIHPLVCYAFNADFDGDQMAVHVPLSAYAQAEARILMLSSHNLFSPAHGGPIVAPSQDIILGCYYLTMMRKLGAGEQPSIDIYSSPEEALLAHSQGKILLHDPITVRIPHRISDDEVRNDIVGLVYGKDNICKRKEGGEWLEVDPPADKDYSSIANRYCTTAGRLIFNQILPELLKYTNEYLFNTLDKKQLTDVVSRVYAKHGKEQCVLFLDELKTLGFEYAMKGGITIAMTDMDSPGKRKELISDAEKEVTRINRLYDRGMLSAAERKRRVLEGWIKAADLVGDAIMAEQTNQYNPLFIITDSGARGSKKQISQLSGMRGLMTDPFGNLIEELPIKSNFHEGLKVLEFFVSTHGARKGMADTALRTADAGYLTRRLVDVAQDVIIRDIDCGTSEGIEQEEILEGGELLEQLSDRIKGRYPLEEVVHPITGELIGNPEEDFTDANAAKLDQVRIAKDDLIRISNGEVAAREGDSLWLSDTRKLLAEGIRRAGSMHETAAETVFDITRSMKVRVRSALTCELRQGICAYCYGRDLASGKLVDIGVATGIIAAQSIGEPGTQLTMRTFHHGGVAGKYLTGVANVKQKRQSALRELHEDISKGLIDLGEEKISDRARNRSIQQVLKVLEDQVRGLLRVGELFESRKPKGQAIVTEHAGKVAEIESKGFRQVVIHTPAPLNQEETHYGLTSDATAGEEILGDTGDVIVKVGDQFTDKQLKLIWNQGVTSVKVRHSYLVPYRGDLKVEMGQRLERGDRLTEGPLDPHKVLELQGPRGVQEYLVREIQSVYKGQGVDINDKHIEVIVRQMLRKRKVRSSGDSRFLMGQIVDKFVFEDENARVRRNEGVEAVSDWVLLSITDASLATESFLSAASFQKTTRVLTDAAVRGKKDELLGLKENVIIGRLIPAGTGLPYYRSLELAGADGSLIEPPKPGDRLPRIPMEEHTAELVGNMLPQMDTLPETGFQLEEPTPSSSFGRKEDARSILEGMFPDSEEDDELDIDAQKSEDDSAASLFTKMFTSPEDVSDDEE